MRGGGQQVSGRKRFVDYTLRPIRYTNYARARMRQRYIRPDDVWWVLENHESDRPGQTATRRELVGTPGMRRILVVIEPSDTEVLVINAFPVD
jgi:hypothetical protein